MLGTVGLQHWVFIRMRGEEERRERGEEGGEEEKEGEEYRGRRGVLVSILVSIV